MRTFLYLDREIAQCGVGSGKYGIHFMCPTCGKIWGTVLGVDSIGGWMCSHTPCVTHTDIFRVGGSFLQTLAWWDSHNGSSVRQQIDRASPSLLVHEALIHAEWLIRHPMGSTFL